ncbi:acyltransferase family protein [Frondihabitans sp. 4ASC-45]|uniref:acyltransferase family protein n=1 Tax=Frondihabitans sp. 4ASC-45 TaxID=3111636 RepID=UPI003C16BC56
MTPGRRSAVAPPTKGHRLDITGLRALAIVPVVAYHAGVTGFSGGFVGVDIFFVISGFLITGQLIRDREATGRIHFGQFWAKRLRRLVPASTLMILLTLPIVLLVLSPEDWSKIGKQAVAALLFVSNFFFARQPDGYFAQDLNLPQPYLHTWSLGVEEQFYVVWPVLIALVVWLALKAKARPRVVLAIIFGVIAVASVTVSIVLTKTDPQNAFYLLPTRAWEFAVAALLALLPRDLIRSAAARTALTAAGIVGIVAIVVLLPSSTPWPGSAALLPVAATLAVILGGMGPADSPRTLPTRILELRPLVWIGTVSYSWYLWHWPLIVLLPKAFKSESPWVPIFAGAIALVIAAVAYFAFENPIRFAPSLTSSVKRSILAAGVMTLVVGLIASGTYWQGRTASIAAERSTAQGPALPPLACDATQKSPSGISECVHGAVDSANTIVVVGDSHTRHWEAALGAAAKEADVRLIVRWDSACPTIPVQTIMTSGHVKAGCATWRTETTKLLTEIHPTAVIVSQAEGYLGRIVAPDGSELSQSAQEAEWLAGYDTWLTQTKKLTDRIAVIRDNPRLHYNPNECLAAPGGTAASCASPRSKALDMIDTLQNLSIEAQVANGVDPVFTTTDRLCDQTTCQVEIDGVRVYRDYNHLSAAYTASLIPSLTEFLQETVRRAKASA